MASSAGEADTPNIANAPVSCELESQPKLESDTVPSSSGTTKNHLFRIGIPLRTMFPVPFYVLVLLVFLRF